MDTHEKAPHVLAGNSNVKEQFPLDEYIDAAIIAYNVADLPPSKFSETDDPVPSVRFLLAGYSKTNVDKDGEPNVIRKWTEWLRISYNSKAKLPKLFTGFPNLPALMQDDEQVGKGLWGTPVKILLESADEKWSRIIRIKPGDNTAPLDIVYDKDFVPYKCVKAFGNLVNLRLAVLKTDEGIKKLSPDDFIDPPEEMS